MKSTDNKSEVSPEFKLQVVAKVVTMLLLFATIVLVNFRVESINQAIRWADWALITFIVITAIGFLINSHLSHSQKPWHMFGRWGLPLAYAVVSLALTYKPF